MKAEDGITSLSAGNQKPIRVLLVVSDFEYGGTQRQVAALANALNASGHPAHVCSLSPFVPLAEGLNNSREVLHIVAKRFKYDVSVVWRLARLIRRLNVTAVHCFLLDAEIAGRLAARLVGTEVAIGSERCSVGKMVAIKRCGLRLTNCLVDGVIANSNAGKERYMRDVGTRANRIHVVYNGVDTDLYAAGDAAKIRRELNLPEDAVVIGMVASFKAHKNHDMYVRACHRVAGHLANAWFLAVGDKLLGDFDGSQERYASIQNLVDHLGLRDRFLFLGNRPDIVDVYHACDVTVLTSFYEGTPNVLLESMACGVPVVATSVSDNAVIVQDGRTGFLVDDGDSHSCGDRLIQLLGDNKLRKAMGQRAQQDMQARFSLRALGENTVSVYQQYLSRPSAGEAGGGRHEGQGLMRTNAATTLPVGRDDGDVP